MPLSRNNQKAVAAPFDSFALNDNFALPRSLSLVVVLLVKGKKNACKGCMRLKK